MGEACRIRDAKSGSKSLTGQDAPVIEYLNQQESVHQYLANVYVAGGCERERISAARIQEPDGVVRLHRWTAPVGVSGGTGGKAIAQQAELKWCCSIVNWSAGWERRAQ